MNIKITRITTLALLIWCTAMTATAQIIDPLANKKEKALPPDSLAEVEDNPFLTDADKKTREPVDSARIKGQEDYAKYIMDKRDRGINEDGSKHWYDNLFVQAGAGAEQIIPYSEDFHFDPLTTAHGALGLQLGKFNSVRVVAHGGLGYQRNYDRMYARLGGKIDHLFDLSSFLNGYQPSRMLGVQTVVGAGAQIARISNGWTGLSKKRMESAVEAHAGLQLRFYTGPNGYLNVEPYMGLASDQIDLSRGNNWRRFDVIYGANINFVYYFTNHLSRQARIRQIEEARRNGNDDWVLYKDVTIDYDSIQRRAMPGRDSILQSWQTPWLFEYAFGANITTSKGLSPMESMGSGARLAIGRWLSPVIGIRITGSERTATWSHQTKEYSNTPYTIHNNLQYYSVGAEGMINPFGLSRNFSWDNPFGGYLLIGGEYGWIKRDEQPTKDNKRTYMHCRSEAYTAGIHLWYQLSKGIQAFVEPRFSHNVYKIPYNGAKGAPSRNERFSDNNYAIYVGLTAQTMTRWKDLSGKSRANDPNYVDDWRRLKVGIGGGLNILPELVSIEGNGTKQAYNLNFHATYFFNDYHGVRLGLEYMTINGTQGNARYYDVKNDPTLGVISQTKTGVWNHQYKVGVASLNYALSLSNVMGIYRSGRLFDLECFMGPGIAKVFGETGDLDENMTLMGGHTAELTNEIKDKTYFVVNGGATLTANITPHIGITLTPQMHFFPLMSLPGVTQGHPRFGKTIDLGVQYKF